MSLPRCASHSAPHSCLAASVMGASSDLSVIVLKSPPPQQGCLSPQTERLSSSVQPGVMEAQHLSSRGNRGIRQYRWNCLLCLPISSSEFSLFSKPWGLALLVSFQAHIYELTSHGCYPSFIYHFYFQEPQEEPNSLVLFPGTMSRGCESLSPLFMLHFSTTSA